MNLNKRAFSVQFKSKYKILQNACSMQKYRKLLAVIFSV